MKEINVGIIGFGFMGKTHTYGYKTIPFYYDNLPFKINLVGVCSKHLENAEKAKNEFGFSYATDNMYDIINDKNINVVHICTPNGLHKDAVIAALDAGKHIYCDKPLASSALEANEIYEKAESSKSLSQMVFNYRFYTVTLRAKQIIDEGKLGNILSFRAVFLHSGSVDKNRPIGWKQDKEMGGGGVLYDLGSHVLDLANHLMGEFSDITCKTQILYDKRPDKNGNMIEITADDAAYMILTMKNGAVGTIEASKVATGINDELRFEIHGDKGSLSFNLSEPDWLMFYDDSNSKEPIGGFSGYTKIECLGRYEKPCNQFPGPKYTVGWTAGHVHCLYSFLDCIANGKAPSPSLKDGAYIQYVMDKAYESAEKGMTFKL